MCMELTLCKQFLAKSRKGNVKDAVCKANIWNICENTNLSVIRGKMNKALESLIFFRHIRKQFLAEETPELVQLV